MYSGIFKVKFMFLYFFSLKSKYSLGLSESLLIFSFGIIPEKKTVSCFDFLYLSFICLLIISIEIFVFEESSFSSFSFGLTVLLND